MEIAGVPVSRRYQRRIRKGLSREYGEVEAADRIAFDVRADRLVVFSDLHRGARDGADDFARCEEAYRAALAHYHRAGHTLVVLGDAEELWECDADEVIPAHRETLVLEAAFHREGRYRRVHGNHDDRWYDATRMREDLGPFFGPDLRGHPSLLLAARDGGTALGEIFLVHGHQGTLDSDRYRRLSRFFLRFIWRGLQRLLRRPSTTPAKDAVLRGRHDLAMHAFAEKRNAKGQRLVLLAGHTHRPVFASVNHVGRLERDLAALRAKGGPAGEVAAKEAEVARRRTSDGPLRLDMAMPCYFNAGCCSYGDGDITGLEIEGGRISLVRWPAGGAPRPEVLESADLATEVFGRLVTPA